MSVSGRIFLHHRDGKTLWVAKHTPTPQDIGKVVLVAQIPPEELAQSFYLFDTPITLVGDDARRAVYDPSAKTDKNVIDAVNSFRSECAKAQDVAGFLQAKLYKAPSAPTMIAPGQHQQHQPMIQQQYQNPQVAYGGSGAVGWGNESNVGNVNQGTNSGSYGGNAGFQQGGYGGGGYNSQQQWGQQQAMMGGVNPQYGGMGMGHGMLHPGGGMNQGANGYPSHQSQGAMMVPPYGAHQMGMMYSGRGRGGGMMRGRGLPSDQMCSEDEVLREPEPLEEFPVEVPEDIMKYYVNGRKKTYVAALPSSKMTVWMRSHEPNPQNYRRYANSANGLTLLMNATVEEIIDSKPVELFDRQLCTFFITRGHCARRGCLHTHRTEEQVKSLIACRHVQLESASKAERRGFVDLIIEREKRMMLEKGTTLPKPEGAVKALRPITPATEAAVARARAEAGHGPDPDDVPVPMIESTDEDDEEVIVSALTEEGTLTEGLTEEERKEKIHAEKNRRRNERRNAREARKLELQMLSNATKSSTGANNNLMIGSSASQGLNARGLQHPGAPNRAVTLGFARPEQVHIKPPRIPRDARIGIATSSDDSSSCSSSSSSSSDSSSSDSDDYDSSRKKARKEDEKKEKELKKRHKKDIQDFDVNMFVLRLEIKDNEKKAFKNIKKEAKEALTAIKECKIHKTKVYEDPKTSTASINDAEEEQEANTPTESPSIIRAEEYESTKNDTKDNEHEENKRHNNGPATKRTRSRTPVSKTCSVERPEENARSKVGGRRKKK